MKLKVLLVDDHDVVREGLRRLLERDNSIEVIGEAGTGRIAIDLTLKLKPDVIIMDVSMPDMNGIVATRKITNKFPAVKIIALSIYSDRGFITEMFDAGASGYMLKDCAYEDLINAIHDVSQNKVYLGPRIADNAD